MPPQGVTIRDIILHSCEKGTSAPRKGTTVDTIVVHYTATGGVTRVTSVVTPAEETFIRRILERAVKLPGLTRQQADSMWSMIEGEGEVSDAVRLAIQNAGLPAEALAHYWIASEAFNSYRHVLDVVESVDPTLQAHHCGPLDKPTNRRSIGIECVYPGPLPGKTPKNEAIRTFENWGWPAPELLKDCNGVRRWYAAADPDQNAALVHLCTKLCKRFPKINAIVPHYTIAPTKRIDPDPPYYLADLRKFVSEAVGRKMYDKPQGPPRCEK